MAMKCPKCGKELRSKSTKTVNEEMVRRLKACNCGYKVKTIEIPLDEYNSMANVFNGLIELITKHSAKGLP